MTTIILCVLAVRVLHVSAWWAAPVVLLAVAYELVRWSVFVDTHRKTTEAALKADEARTFALGAALESRRLADAFAPSPVQADDPTPEIKTSPDIAGKPERPHNL